MTMKGKAKTVRMAAARILSLKNRGDDFIRLVPCVVVVVNVQDCSAAWRALPGRDHVLHLPVRFEPQRMYVRVS